MPAPKNNVRRKAAAALVSAGVPPARALVQAGYSPKTARGYNSTSHKGMAAAIAKAQEEYLASYLKKAKKLKMDGAYAVDKLFQITQNGDDFNTIQALKLHHLVMLKPMEKASHVNLSGIFVVPQGNPAPNIWEAAAQITAKKALEAVTVPQPQPQQEGEAS